MVATLKKPRMNEGGSGNHGCRGAFWVHFWALKKNTGLSKIAFISYKKSYLKTLSADDDRSELPKMGDQTFSFVHKSLEYCRQNPDLVPQFLDVADFEVDLNGYEPVRSLYQPLLQITDALSDTMKLSGSEAYTAALIFYNAKSSGLIQFCSQTVFFSNLN
jgi:hypothetical protein